MYIIVVYDVGQKRVVKVLKFLRRHLHWIQNSVFEGEVTPAQYQEIEYGIKKRIKEKTDSVYLFSMRNHKLLSKKIIGRELNEISNIL